MKCSACRDQLSAFADRTLSPALAAQVQEHLDGCVGCRTFAEEMMVVGLFLGKFVVSAAGLYRVADHFHLTAIALAGGVVEGCAFLFFLYAGRHYLAKVQSAFFGAQTT